MGNSRENIGFSLHTVLAMEPEAQQILGCITLEPFIRKLAPTGETQAQAPRNESENRRSGNAVCTRLGRVPANHQWIYVGDSGSDVYTFWQTCEQLGYDFVLRVAQDRDVDMPETEAEAALSHKHLKTLARSLPARDARAGEHPCPASTAQARSRVTNDLSISTSAPASSRSLLA